MTRAAVRAVGVLVPAHDEAETVGACVRSVLTALDRLPGLHAGVCVLADRCTDGTAARARAAAAGHPATARVRVRVLEPAPPGTGPRAPERRLHAVGRPGSSPAPTAPVAEPAAPPVGALRTRAARAVLRSLRTDPASTWLLSTDADGTVTPGWVREHLALAAAGADAVTGGVVLDLPGRPRPPGEPAWSGHPVYAANLGLRADAFDAVGGFPAVACGEDHGIVARLRSAGFRVVPGAPGTVHTSARTRGRARGGLADLLRGSTAGVEPPGAGRPVA